jgi:hypothetical protein
MSLHLRLLEAARADGHAWIELLFGAAAERFNLFPPALVPDALRTAPDATLLECRQVPFRVFASSHPRPPTAKAPDPEIALGPVLPTPHRGLRASPESSVVRSVRGEPTASSVCVGRHRFSVLFTQQCLVDTVCAAHNIAWCVANGIVIRQIERPGVDALAVSAERRTVFAARGHMVEEFRVNGDPRGSWEAEERVTDVTSAPLPWCGGLVIAVVTQMWKVVCIAEDGGALITSGEVKKVAESAIRALEFNDDGAKLSHRSRYSQKLSLKLMCIHGFRRGFINSFQHLVPQYTTDRNAPLPELLQTLPSCQSAVLRRTF